MSFTVAVSAALLVPSAVSVTDGFGAIVTVLAGPNSVSVCAVEVLLGTTDMSLAVMEYWPGVVEDTSVAVYVPSPLSVVGPGVGPVGAAGLEAKVTVSPP